MPPETKMPPHHPEIGRELKPSELREMLIVWVAKENRNSIATMWVKTITPEMVILYAGVSNIHLVLHRQGDELRDDDEKMHLYQYLGKDQPQMG
jgi:hypothetical protein